MTYTLTLAEAETGIILEIYDICHCSDSACDKTHADPGQLSDLAREMNASIEANEALRKEMQ